MACWHLRIGGGTQSKSVKVELFDRGERAASRHAAAGLMALAGKHLRTPGTGLWTDWQQALPLESALEESLGKGKGLMGADERLLEALRGGKWRAVLLSEQVEAGDERSKRWATREGFYRQLGALFFMHSLIGYEGLFNEGFSPERMRNSGGRMLADMPTELNPEGMQRMLGMEAEKMPAAKEEGAGGGPLPGHSAEASVAKASFMDRCGERVAGRLTEGFMGEAFGELKDSQEMACNAPDHRRELSEELSVFFEESSTRWGLKLNPWELYQMRAGFMGQLLELTECPEWRREELLPVSSSAFPEAERRVALVSDIWRKVSEEGDREKATAYKSLHGKQTRQWTKHKEGLRETCDFELKCIELEPLGDGAFRNILRVERGVKRLPGESVFLIWRKENSRPLEIRVMEKQESDRQISPYFRQRWAQYFLSLSSEVVSAPAKRCVELSGEALWIADRVAETLEPSEVSRELHRLLRSHTLNPEQRALRNNVEEINQRLKAELERVGQEPNGYQDDDEVLYSMLGWGDDDDNGSQLKELEEGLLNYGLAIGISELPDDRLAVREEDWDEPAFLSALAESCYLRFLYGDWNLFNRSLDLRGATWDGRSLCLPDYFQNSDSTLYKDAWDFFWSHYQRNLEAERRGGILSGGILATVDAQPDQRIS